MKNQMDTINTEEAAAQKTREYWAKLTEYEGPLDILLHFVKEDELNIYNIPIAKITKDFLDYINYMTSLDIEVAGEFLLMASELMKIKARMLIPSVAEAGEEDEEDPRLTLIRKLLEYKRFKDASMEISKFEDEARKIYSRSYFDNDEKEFETEFEIDPSLKNLTIFNLIKGYRNAVLSVRKEIVHPIELLNVTPELQREFLLEFFKSHSEIDFHELITNMDERMLVICTFLSILQLALEGYISIYVDRENLSKFTLAKAGIEIV
ncbi:MAG: segregation/condensation protein A [Ignavibacteriae bacterium]|nr:segregation/condensation protein A [Ignavibacteriota bacterium]